MIILTSTKLKYVFFSFLKIIDCISYMHDKKKIYAIQLNDLAVGVRIYAF